MVDRLHLLAQVCLRKLCPYDAISSGIDTQGISSSSLPLPEVFPGKLGTSTIIIPAAFSGILIQFTWELLEYYILIVHIVHPVIGFQMAWASQPYPLCYDSHSLCVRHPMFLITNTARTVRYDFLPHWTTPR